jgi:hypothetical protein
MAFIENDWLQAGKKEALASAGAGFRVVGAVADALYRKTEGSRELMLLMAASKVRKLYQRNVRQPFHSRRKFF